QQRIPRLPLLDDFTPCDIVTQPETKFLPPTLRRGTERKGRRREGKSSMTRADGRMRPREVDAKSGCA
ncbi:hypothetical protein AVEN_152659-1, partial [Araneus ventricosus]